MNAPDENTTHLSDDLTIPMLDEVLEEIEPVLLTDDLTLVRQEVIEALAPRLEGLVEKAAERAARKFERRLRRKMLDYLERELPHLIDRELTQRLKKE